MPRTAIFAIYPSAVPFLVAIDLLLPEQKWIALVAGLPLLASLWTLMLQNHNVLDRLMIAERRSRLLANMDALTGRPNRLSFLRHQDSLPTGAGAKSGYAYIFVDLDGFKAPNDKHGHPAGDLLLKTVAQRLKKNTRTGDITFRIGDDEFIVYMPVATSEECTKVASGIIGCMGAHLILLTACPLILAAALAERASIKPLHLRPFILRAADEALYKAKAAGKRRCVHAA